jgi:hypothetical protein
MSSPTTLVDQEWEEYMKSQTQDRTFAFAGVLLKQTPPLIKPPTTPLRHDADDPAPACDALNISTKTKALFFNQEIDIHSVFWEIPILQYWVPQCGVVKKQMKVVSNTPEELNIYLQRLENIPFYMEQIIRQINNIRRVKYKDERKISIGLSQKDILSARGKKKNAFYNCFALILRIQYKEDDQQFREVHVKLFNTGKMEIPGVLNPALLDAVKIQLLHLLRPLVSEELAFLDNEECDGVLINSNFNCGYHIDRDRLYEILRSDKYGLETAYDSCSYPGIKCKFYFNHDLGFDHALQRGRVDESDRLLKLSELGKKNVKYTEVSFMIFRTGSCLVVGNCSEIVLNFVYDFLKTVFVQEYSQICVRRRDDDDILPTKVTKPIKKTVDMTMEYCQSLNPRPL